jgi:hypothetical protein
MMEDLSQGPQREKLRNSWINDMAGDLVENQSLCHVLLIMPLGTAPYGLHMSTRASIYDSRADV